MTDAEVRSSRRNCINPSLSQLISGLILAIVVSSALGAPAYADTGDDPLTTASVVDALDNLGTRVSGSAPAKITREGVVSNTNGIKLTIPRDPSVPVELGQDMELAIGVPGGDSNTSSVVKNGVSIYRNAADNTATAVKPMEDGGAQFLVTIGGFDSPTTYDYPVTVPEGATLQLTEDGGAEVVLRDGSLAAAISSPWAVDANGRPVPTYFQTDGGSLTQVVDHRGAGVTYPIIADPKVFSCDLYTNICIKTTKAETKLMARHLNAGLGLGASVCAIVAFAGGVPGAVCAVAVAIGGGLLADSITNAAAKSKCIEFHFLRPSVVQPKIILTRWKTEAC